MTHQSALILIVEDEAEIADILAKYVAREGMKPLIARDGDTALALHLQQRPNLVLLDVKLPRRDGFDVLTTLRRRGSTPVIMLTAMDEDSYKLQALRMGADDYVVKPFNPLEVVARIKSVLRRSSGQTPSEAPLRVGSLEIDSKAMSVAVVDSDGNTKSQILFTPAEFKVIDMLASSPHRIFSRAEIIETCFPESDAIDRVIDSHVSRIRFKLRDQGSPDRIQSVRGIGYRFETNS